MNRKQRFSTLVLMIAMCLFLTTPVCAAVRINKNSASITVGAKLKLRLIGARGVPEWSTNKPNIVKVSSTGYVKGLKPGKAEVYGIYRGKTHKCKITVRNADAIAQDLTITVAGGGSFVQSASKAMISFTLDATSTNVKVMIKNSSDKTVFIKTLKTCKKGKTVSFKWNGKDKKGNHVAAGDYYVSVKAGKVTTKSDSPLTIINKAFSGGNGSKNSPYLISTIEDFKNIVNYNGAYFKQVKDISGGLEDFEPMFSIDQPFTGTYDGNGKVVKDLIIKSSSSCTSLFVSVGENGAVKNLTVKNVNIIVNNNEDAYCGVLAVDNHGLIDNCSIMDCTISINAKCIYIGSLCRWVSNTGTVSGCTINSIKVLGNCGGEYRGSYIGGITQFNEGRISSSSIHGSEITAIARTWGSNGDVNASVAALVENNKATMMNDKATNIVTSVRGLGCRSAGICAYNTGYILSCNIVNCDVMIEGVIDNNGTIS